MTAQIVPAGWRELKVTGAAQREIETLEVLESGLRDDLVVFHGVHWTRVDKGYAVVGEIDFVVLAPCGRVLLIEQKSGFLDETPEGLVKAYAGLEKNVAFQLTRTREALLRRLAQLLHGETPHLDYLLYCPDYQVKKAATAGIPADRIVDARQRGQLCARIHAALPEEPARDALAHRLRKFFADELQLVPDVSSMIGRAGQWTTRLAGGLALWARRLEFAPFRLRVVGTAGSGKTQLALAVLQDAAAAGRTALYVCYNRPLADHMARIAPAGVEVASFHQLCDRCLRASGQGVDFSQPGAFDELARRFAGLPVAAIFDELVIDEGQDFDAAWVAPLLGRLQPAGRAWWLEDPVQNLYRREPVALDGWVTLHADANYRSPRGVLAQLNQLLALPRPIEAASPFAGDDVEYLKYGDGQLIAVTRRAITLALAAGFRREDIVVLTYAGRDRSALRPFDQLGVHRLKSFTGEYDMFGTPLYSDGDLLLETVHRFKGRAAPCVILTEVDFEALDELVERRLFVGATRASMKLILVLSERAENCLRERLEAA